MDDNTLEISHQSELAGKHPPFSDLFFEQFLDALCDGVYFVDKERKILYWNRGAEKLTGYSPDEAVGRYCNSGFFDHTDGAGCNLCEVNCPLLQAIETQEPQDKRAFLHHKDRRRIAIHIYAIPLKNEAGEIAGVVGIFRDASAVVALEDAYNKLRELSEKDTLTGVTNRRQFDKSIKDQLGLLRRTGIPFSMILLEIDRLKEIKKIHGHEARNKILVYFSQLLQRQCCGSDSIGRFNEDKFLILLRQQNLGFALEMAERLRIAVLSSLSEELPQARLSASFGVTEATLDDTMNSLLKRAAKALHQAKIDGGNIVESLEPATVA